MKFEKIIDTIESTVPIELQEDWDNSGIQLSVHYGKIERILVALEITDEVISEAKAMEIDMIVTHHPLIFGALTSVNKEDITGQYIIDLISDGISVYSSHTPFDKVKGGNNDYIADLLGLTDVRGFSAAYGYEMIGRTGEFAEIQSLEAAALMISKRLDVPLEKMNIVGDLNEPIKKAGICTGAGADQISLAIDNCCDLFITGDLKYHDAQKAKSLGLCVIDAGHFGTEKFFSRNFAELMRKELPEDIEVFESLVDLDPYNVL